MRKSSINLDPINLGSFLSNLLGDMKYTVFDIETDGLLDTVSKIHCLSYASFNGEELIKKGTLSTKEEIINFISDCENETLVGHNIILYDIPVLEKLLGLEIKSKLIDTLALSWYLYPERVSHGLEDWGEDLGYKKPEISDWENLSLEEYSFRCESDVEINTRLFKNQLDYLYKLYDFDTQRISNLISYLSFKLSCAREQEIVKTKIDKRAVLKHLKNLKDLREEKINDLKRAMPKVILWKEVNPPQKLYKKDGSLSKRGEKWLNLLEKEGLPPDYNNPILIENGFEEPNPQSVTQLKNWLFSLGWEPETFEYRKNVKGEINEVPQIYVGSKVCPSIEKLYSIEPTLERLDMLSLIKHRIGVFKGFLENMDSKDFVIPRIRGFTNTLRFKHSKPIVNLPKVFLFYGKEIRGSIIAPDEDHILCGSDMSSLEDSTKQHYMFFFDPEYVTQMRVPGFDPHIDIAVLSGLMTEEQSKTYKKIKKKNSDFEKGLCEKPTEEELKELQKLDLIRGIAKTINFAGIYGAGPSKIAQSAGLSLKEATKLHKTYWDRNKAVKLVAKACKIKKVKTEFGEQLWLLNPLSNFYYSLRYEKDVFSTLNQGSGVYCFDLWVRKVREKGIKIMFQMHDEIAFPLKKGEEETVRKLLLEAVEEVNEILSLNVPLGVSVDFGENYSIIH